jgi:predicted dehydrogenase
MAAPLRTALIGLGRMGAGYADDPAMKQAFRYAAHAEVLREHPGFRWCASVDPAPAARAAAQARWGVPAFASAAEVPEAEAIEAAVLAMPPEGRTAALDAFPNLRAVLVEKPLGATLADAERFAASCAARGVLVQVNLMRRCDATVRLLADGGLRARIGAAQAAWVVYGNGLLNNGTHLVDLVRLLLGEIVAVQVIGDPARAFAESPLRDDTNVAFAAQLADGLAVGFAPLSFAHFRENALEVVGERGRLAYRRGGLLVQSTGVVGGQPPFDARALAELPAETLAPTIGEALYHVYTDLADALAHGGAPASGAESALRTAAVVDAVRRSLHAGGAPVDCRPAAARR